jgi:hypothetical protein
MQSPSIKGLQRHKGQQGFILATLLSFASFMSFVSRIEKAESRQASTNADKAAL